MSDEHARLWQLCFDTDDGSDGVLALGRDQIAAGEARAVLVSAADFDGDDAAVLAELGRLTSMLVPQIVWLRAEPVEAVTRERLRALGFVPAGAFDDAFAYAYDLARSNQPRDWNTPEHWANPAQFNKRW